MSCCSSWRLVLLDPTPPRAPIRFTRRQPSASALEVRSALPDAPPSASAPAYAFSSFSYSRTSVSCARKATRRALAGGRAPSGSSSHVPFSALRLRRRHACAGIAGTGRGEKCTSLGATAAAANAGRGGCAMGGVLYVSRWPLAQGSRGGSVGIGLSVLLAVSIGVGVVLLSEYNGGATGIGLSRLAAATSGETGRSSGGSGGSGAAR
mmetsp:Transcript_32431/g.74696  ORF Transcript_32431/g.74696 Transcript_32431/m.74696 type:complete len:208 (-) Transcript_32431:480-1103(-)